MDAILSLLDHLIEAYEIIIVVGAIMSWVPRRPGSVLEQVYAAISTLTEPFLNLFRRILPTVGGDGMSIDFSPLVAIIVLDIVKRFI